MNRFRTAALTSAVFAAGLLFGRLSQPATAMAQDDAAAEPPAPLSEASTNEVRASVRALESARDELEREGRYEPATTGVNPFLVLSGGGSAVEDLEGDQGVDPETFAALYAGRASDAVKEHLATDDDGRLLYKGTAVRMYSIEKLRRMYTQRDRLSADDAGF